MSNVNKTKRHAPRQDDLHKFRKEPNKNTFLARDLVVWDKIKRGFFQVSDSTGVLEQVSLGVFSLLLVAVQFSSLLPAIITAS